MRLIKIILSFTVVFLTPLLQAEPLQPLPGIEQAAYENAGFGSSRGTSVVVKKQVIHHAPALYLHICTEFLSQS